MKLNELPALKQALEGGIFAGITTMPDGAHVAVVWLNEAKPAKRLNHAAALAWAESTGGQLITRAIASLLVASLGDMLPQTWVWTCEELEGESACAWYCNLTFGDVDYYDRSAEGGAVAVRLIPLTL